MDQQHYEALLAAFSAQINQALGELHLAADALADEDTRRADPEKDKQAARLEKSFYRLLRLSRELGGAALLGDESPLCLRDQDLSALVEDVCDEAAALAALSQRTVRLEDQLGHRICALDRGAVEQILLQLLSNAIKFTPAGGAVTVTLRMGEGQLLLSVADSGCGMSDETLARIFDDTIAPPQTQSPPRGAGVGLALCRALARRHGGALVATSREGVGSVFTLSLPDKLCGSEVRDHPVPYSGGFSPVRLWLSDALGADSFRLGGT